MSTNVYIFFLVPPRSKECLPQCQQGFKPPNQTCQVSQTWQVVVNRRPSGPDARRDLRSLQEGSGKINMTTGIYTCQVCRRPAAKRDLALMPAFCSASSKIVIEPIILSDVIILICCSLHSKKQAFLCRAKERYIVPKRRELWETLPRCLDSLDEI
jgi:hypothetical protein